MEKINIDIDGNNIKKINIVLVKRCMLISLLQPLRSLSEALILTYEEGN